MKTLFKAALLAGAFIISLFPLYIGRRWFINKFEYKRALFILVSNRTPNQVAIYTNCLFGVDLKFNSGIAAIDIGEATNISIQDRLNGVTIRVIDRKQAIKLVSNSHSSEWYKQSKRLVKILPDDSTSLCGHYKTIFLK